MKLKLDFLTKLKRLFWDINYIHSIHTLSIEKWHLIHEKGQFNLLYRFLPIGLEKVWSKIMDEYIQEIGLPQDYKDYINNLSRIALKQMECVQNRTPINMAELAILQSELDEKKEKEKIKFGQLLAHVSRKQGYQVRKDISVYEFYSILNERPN